MILTREKKNNSTKFNTHENYMLFNTFHLSAGHSHNSDKASIVRKRGKKDHTYDFDMTD